MYLGLSDGQYLAQHLAENIINGNWSYAQDEFQKLNPFQAVYTFWLFESEGYLDKDDRDRFARMLSREMNDDEVKPKGVYC